MTSRSNFPDYEDAQRVYRLIAEGELDQALSAFHDAFGRQYALRHPGAEKQLVANIARGRAKEASHAQN